MGHSTIRGVATRALLLSSAAWLALSTPAFAQAAAQATQPTATTPTVQPTPSAPSVPSTPQNGGAVPVAGTPPDGASAGAPTSEIVVTGTRLAISGYKQPTPVTVIGAAQLQRDAQPDLISTLAQIPAMGPVSSPHNSSTSVQISSGIAGLSLANLRDLGSGRTLVLFDGVRAVQSLESGGVDLSLMPTSLVERIDVVTGGASAAWGSDAVAGVINIVMNKHFTGLLLNAEGGTDERGLMPSGKFEATWGSDVLDGRGHLILSGSYYDSPDLVTINQEPWYKSQGLVSNPNYTPTNGQPKLIHADYVGLAADSQGGLITSGPLRGTMFGANGQPLPFTFGNVTNVVQSGGTFLDPTQNGEAQNLSLPIKTGQLFAHFSYKINNNINANFEINYGETESQNSAVSYTRNVNITIDNPYLDPSIVARMMAAGVTSFTLGTTNANNENLKAGVGPLGNVGVGNWNNDVTNQLWREVASFDGSFSLLGHWDWKVDVQHSESERHTHIVTDPIVANYNLAVDAVRVTAANVGSSGLTVGSIACRSTLTNPSNGCVPLNVLGIGVASPAAIAYINGGPAESNLTFGQTTVDAALRGQPFSTWAGPVAVALGVDYRLETTKQTADALSYARAYTVGNFQYYNSSQDDWEGFVEVNVPLLSNMLVKSLDFNAAARETDYSTSGPVTTWKFGLTSQLNDDFRVRGTYSQDIRAPYLTALYNPGSSTVQIVNDGANGATNVTTLTRGNPDLKPETATTESLGLVFTPHFIHGLSASLDWYHINITNAFATPQADFIVQNCAAGNQAFCALIVRSPTTHLITTLDVEPINSADQMTEGYDFQVDYRRPAFGGDILVSLVGNYTRDNRTDVFGVITHLAGTNLNSFANPGYPKVRATLDVTYNKDRFSGTVQFRGLSAAKLNQAYGPGSVDDNTVPSQGYVDLRASYDLLKDRNLKIYAAIDNLLARNPPNIPDDPTAAYSYFFAPTRTDIYDSFGRVYRFGIRAKF